VWGAQVGEIQNKNFPDELQKPIACYGGTYRSAKYEPTYMYSQVTGIIGDGYHARHVASGCRTAWRWGCSNWLDFHAFQEHTRC
jgi:hypothetical protein